MATTDRFEWLHGKSHRAWKSSCCSEHAVFITDRALGEFVSRLEQFDSSSDSRSDLLDVTAHLLRTLAVCRELSVALDSAMEKRIRRIILQFSQHATETVRYRCVDFHKVVLDIHCRHCAECSSGSPICAEMKEWAQELLDNRLDARIFYTCLTQCRTALGARFEIDDRSWRLMYDKLQVYHLAAVIVDLICGEILSGRDYAMHITLMTDTLALDSTDIRRAAVERLIKGIGRLPLSISDYVCRDLTRSLATSSSNHALDARLTIARTVLVKDGTTAKHWSEFVSPSTLAYALLNATNTLRVSAWQLLCNNVRPSQPMQVADLRLAHAFWIASQAEEEPSVRQKMLTSLNRFLVRLAESYSAQLREGEERDDDVSGDAEHASLADHVQFLNDLVDYAIAALDASSNSNSTRRMLAIFTVNAIIGTTGLRDAGRGLLFANFAQHRDFLKDAAVFLHALADDDVECRALVIQVLSTCQSMIDIECLRDTALANTHSVRTHSESIVASHLTLLTELHNRNVTSVDMLSILRELVDDAEQRIEAAERRLSAIAEPSGSLHTVLGALNRIFVTLKVRDSDRESLALLITDRLFPMLLRCAAVVSPVVHSLSPEGFVMDDPAQQGEQQSDWKQSQLLLACSWRTHREVSSLLHILIAILPQQSAEQWEDRVAAYYSTQLTECKHRGAFETAADGAMALCNRPGARRLANRWLTSIFEGLDESTDVLDRLVETRRSAGVPLLFVCALSALRFEGNQLSDTMNRLVGVLERPSSSNAVRVHAFNILMGVFLSSVLTEHVVPWIERSLCLSIDASCNSDGKSWGVASSASHLLAVLRNRVFGLLPASCRAPVVEQQLRLQAEQFFDRFKSLSPFLVDVLKTEGRVALPVLVFFTHLTVSAPADTAPLAVFLAPLFRLAVTSADDRVRRSGAAALCCVTTDDQLSDLLDSLSAQAPRLPQNQLCGVVYLLLGAIRRPKDQPTPSARLQESCRMMASTLSTSYEVLHQSCPFVRRYLLRAWNELELPLTSDLSTCFNRWIDETDQLDLIADPLAAYILSSDSLDGDVLRDLTKTRHVRRACYRILLRGQVQIKERLEDFIRWAVVDAQHLDEEETCHRMPVFEMLLRHHELLTAKDHETLLPIVKAQVENHRIGRYTRQSSILRSLELIFSTSAPSADWLHWFEHLSDETDSNEAKLIALQAAATSWNAHPRSDDPTTAAIALYLQDVDGAIRRKASQVLSSWITDGKHDAVHPSLCWRLALGRIPLLATKQRELGARISTVAATDAELFDSCSKNPFAEPYPVRLSKRALGDLDYAIGLCARKE